MCMNSQPRTFYPSIMQTSIRKNSFSDMITFHLYMENCVLVINFMHEQSFMGLVYVICLHVFEKEFIHNLMNCFWTHCYMPFSPSPCLILSFISFPYWSQIVSTFSFSTPPNLSPFFLLPIPSLLSPSPQIWKWPLVCSLMFPFVSNNALTYPICLTQNHSPFI